MAGLRSLSNVGGRPVTDEEPLPVTGTFTATVDSEFPAAAALADNTANPTTTSVAAFGMLFDGTTWDRWPNGAGTAAAAARVTHASDDPVTTALQIMDDWDSTDACKTVGIATFVQGTIDGATTIAAAGNYAANDVVSNDATSGQGDPWLFTSLARVSGGSGRIKRAVITCSAQAVVWRLRLWLFNANPTACELDDNEAFSLDADDRTKVIGYIDFPAMFDAGEVSFTHNPDVNLEYKAVGSANIYGILQTLDAETNEAAAMTMTIELHTDQD